MDVERSHSTDEVRVWRRTDGGRGKMEEERKRMGGVRVCWCKSVLVRNELFNEVIQ